MSEPPLRLPLESAFADIPDTALADRLARELKQAGAVLAGFADLRPVRPRPREDLPRGVSLALPFDAPDLARRPGREAADPAYVEAYRRSRAKVDVVVARGLEVLRAAGHEARGYGYEIFLDGLGGDMNPEAYLTALYQHKTTACRAALGWIGRMGVLVTREYGPHVWLGTIFTDAPLPAAEPRVDSGCGSCRRCVEACPVGAIRGTTWRAGLTRDDLLDVKTCQAHRRARSGRNSLPMCGLCLAACPFGYRHFY